jgi:hypothetical protein
MSAVYIVFLLDLASTTMCFADSYHWFAAGFGNLSALDDIYLSAIDTPMIGSLLAAIAQCYYCYRLWRFSRYTLPICILAVLVCIFLMSSICIIKFVCEIALAQVGSGMYGAIVVRFCLPL